MKKSLFMLAAGALAFTACTSTDVVEEGIQSNAIGFQNLVGKETRGLTSGTDGNFEKFYVFSYYLKSDATDKPISVFDGDEVTFENAKWGYTNTRYWVPGATYFFYAYSCENSKTAGGATIGVNLNGTTKEARALKLNNYTTHNHHDLIFASNDDGIIGKESGNVDVPLTFKHILSKINVVFDSDFAPDYNIVVSNVAIENVYNTANYNPYGTNKWSGHKQTKGESEEFTSVAFNLLSGKNVASAKDPNKDDSEELLAETEDGYVIPHNYTTSLIRLSFNIALQQGGVTIFSRPVTGTWYPKWEEGKAYTYHVTISGESANLEEIVFDATQTISEWGANEIQDVDVSMNFKKPTETPAE